MYHSTKALRLNAKQISDYLRAYFDYSSDFPIQRYYELQDLLDRTEKDLQSLVTLMVKDGASSHITENLIHLRQNYLYYIQEVGKICKGIWAKFDMMSISIGILTLILAISTNIYYLEVSKDTDIPSSVIIIVLYCLLYLTFALFQSFIAGESLTAFMVYILAGVGIVMVWVMIYNLSKSSENKAKESHLNLEISNICSWMTILLYFVSFFSNSFVVYEDTSILFLTQTLLWVYCFKCVGAAVPKSETAQCEQKSKRHKVLNKTYDIMRSLTHPVCLSVSLTFIICVLLRISSNFRACREEQWTCSLSLFLYPLTSLPEEYASYRNMRYFFSVGCVICFVLVIRRYFRHSGNLQGQSPGILCVKYIYFFCGVAIALHWSLQGLPQPILDALPMWQQVLLPRLVFILLFISFIATVLKPLTIHLLPKQDTFSVQADETVIPQVYNKVKESLSETTDSQQPPIVFGLGTTYSAAILNFVVIIYLLLTLLLGDGPSPSLLLAFLCFFMFLELYTASGSFTKMVFSGNEMSGFSMTKACKFEV